MPVGFCPESTGPDALLVHPASDAAAIAAARVGYVARAWYDGPSMSTLAVLAIDSDLVHRGLVRRERARRLRGMGISVLFDFDALSFRDHGSHMFEYEFVDVRAGGVLSVDLVSHPDGVGCHVLRSIRSIKEDS